jgi:hypothetical protein
MYITDFCEIKGKKIGLKTASRKIEPKQTAASESSLAEEPQAVAATDDDRKATYTCLCMHAFACTNNRNYRRKLKDLIT